VVLVAANGAAAAQSQDSIPSGVPDHYPALRTYAEGEIIEVMDGGRALRIRPPVGDRGFGGAIGDPGDSRDQGSLLTQPQAIAFDRGEQIVIMRNVQGWLFIDDRDDDAPQERLRLDAGRERFAPGQYVEIGAAPGLKSGASEGSAQTQSFGVQGAGVAGTVPSITLSGWVYIRLNPFKADEAEQQR
jgi:hypothetical protein